MPSQNESMRDLQDTLLRQFKKLHDSLDDVTDADKAKAIVLEMQEINHRIALAGSLLHFGLKWRSIAQALGSIGNLARARAAPSRMAAVEVPNTWFAWGMALSTAFVCLAAPG